MYSVGATADAAPAQPAGFRPAAREVLLDFAGAVAGAGDRAEMVDVLASVEEYVERVLEAG